MYDAVLVYANRPLDYPWGTEVPTVESLSDAAYLDGLKGVSVVMHHVPGTQHVEDGRAPERGEGRRVGAVLSARFDSTEGEAGAVIVELAVHKPQDQLEVERLGGVSEAYHAQTRPAGGGVQVQTVRFPNSVAVTNSPRAEGAQIRVDEESAMDDDKKKGMDPEAVLKMIADANGRADAEKARADKAEAFIEKMKADQKKAADEDAEKKKERADARDAEIDKLANERAAELIKLEKRADSLGVKVPETAITLADRKTAVAKALGCPDGTDAEAFITGVEQARAKGVAHADSASAFRESATTTQDVGTDVWAV